MYLKILSLNLKEYENWEARFPNIIAEIKKYNPDIIALQEVVVDKEKSDFSTGEQLNQELNYPYMEFCPCFDYSGDYGKGILQKKSVIGGLFIISKLSFVSINQDLPIIKGIDRRPRKALFCDFGKFTLANIHFSNKSCESRELQWKELKKADVLVGDFNTLPDELAPRLTQEKYISSYDYSSYISYPSNGMTLDYCLLKKGSFKKVVCLDKELSDHALMVYDIEL